MEWVKYRDLFSLYNESFFKKSLKPPYHVPTLDLGSLNEIMTAPVIMVQKKYDGTHLQVTRDGIFNHNNVTPDENIMRFLIRLYDESLEFRQLLSSVVNGELYGFNFELFGRKYTPKKYHKDYERDIDFRVFDWVDSELEYKPVNELPFLYSAVETVEFNPKEYSVDELFSKINDLALREDWFEGAVVKVYEPEFRVFKWKPKEYLRIPERFKRSEKMRVIYSETIDELDKLGGEVFNHSSENLAVKIRDYLMDSHPEVVGRMNPDQLKNIVREIVKYYLTQSFS